MNLAVLQHELGQSRPYFEAVNPSLNAVIKHRSIRMAAGVYVAAKTAWELRGKQKSASDVTSSILAGGIIAGITSPGRAGLRKTHFHVRCVGKRDFFRKNGLGGRSWICSPTRREMTIVFHDANKAGPHLDVHIGRFSMIYRVKPDVYEKLRYNNQGRLTQESRELLLEMLRGEIGNNSRVPQNLDHTITNGRMEWFNGDPTDMSYGAGVTRQIVAQDTVDIYKICSSIEMYAPLLVPHRGTFIYKLYPGNGKSAPILVWGARTNQPPKLDPKLSLTLVQPENMDKLYRNADMETSTAKIDGSATHIVSGPRGTLFYSPRVSKETGMQIDYTPKLGPLVRTKPSKQYVAMGELVFKQKSLLPWRRTYIPQQRAGGMLNSNEVLPKGIKPEVWIYRVDKADGKRVLDKLDFWENRKLQKELAWSNPLYMKVVPLATPEEAARRGWEGVVAGRSDKPVTEFYKVKFWQDGYHDWRLDEVNLYTGPRGGTAGVVKFTSLESGRVFSLGPGQLGDREFTKALEECPECYTGKVARVKSRHGTHEGRASKLVDFHNDKGMG